MRPSLIVASAILVATCVFGGAGRLAPRSADASPPHKLTTIRLGILPIADLYGLYSGIERGYFRQQGIDLKLTPMAGGATILPALQGGSLDMGFSNVFSAILANSHGLKPVILTPGDYDTRAHPAHAILVMKNSSIHSGKGLNGKTIAINTLNSIDHIAMQQWIKVHGGNPASVHFTEIDFPQMLGPLTHGQVDAANESEPAVTIGKTLGARILGYQFAGLQKYTLLASIVAMRPWVQKHQGLVRRFVLAYNRSNTWANAHPTAARKYLEPYTRLPSNVASSINLPLEGRKIKMADLTYWVTLARRWHALTGKVTLKNLLWSTAR